MEGHLCFEFGKFDKPFVLLTNYHLTLLTVQFVTAVSKMKDVYDLCVSLPLIHTHWAMWLGL